MSDVDPSMFPVHVTAVGSATSYERGYQMGYEVARTEVAALLDTLSVEDLREAAQALFWRAHHHAHNGDEARAEALIASGDALDRAADALAALKETTMDSAATPLDSHVASMDSPAETLHFHGVEDQRPHSRACGWRNHPHGPECSTNCPTCHGEAQTNG
jgi:hypothetical protein